MRHTIFILFSSLLLTCTLVEEGHYQLNSPESVFELSSKLDEISGLQALSDSVLLAVQDEKAMLYYLNLKGEIIDQKAFGKNGDFEGVTSFENDLYILKSNGDLVRIKKGKRKSYEFKSKGVFDFEGLCTDNMNNRLLLACKTHAKKGKNDNIYIYAFDLVKKKFEKNPVFKIKKEISFGDFRASACAIHPNGNLFLLSSTAKALMLINSKGKVIETYFLSSQLFNQPEGITFLSDGRLIISNEKKNTCPSILIFSPQ